MYIVYSHADTRLHSHVGSQRQFLRVAQVEEFEFELNEVYSVDIVMSTGEGGAAFPSLVAATSSCIAGQGFPSRSKTMTTQTQNVILFPLTRGTLFHRTSLRFCRWLGKQLCQAKARRLISEIRSTRELRGPQACGEAAWRLLLAI